MLKKIISLLLLSALILTFAGCKDETEESNETSQPREFAIGKVENNVYSNTFIGIKIILDSSWTFHSEDEIKALNNQTADMINDDEYLEKIQQADTIYDMYASKKNGTNVIVTLDKVTPDKKADYFDDAMKAELRTTYTKMRFSNVNIEDRETLIDGELYKGLAISATADGQTYIQQRSIAVDCGDYMAVIAISGLSSGEIETIIDCIDRLL